MDHQAFAQLLGNYGEFIGAIAVVATLAYLTISIRQNTKSLEMSQDHARAQTNLAYISLQTNAMLTIASSDEISRLRERALDDWKSLSVNERLRVNNVLAQQLIHYSLVYRLVKGGLMQSSQIDGVRNGLSIFFSSDPLAQRLWPRVRGYDWDPDMASYVELVLARLAEGGASANED